jgi:diacylglycerol kinase family enzyme
MSSEVIERVKKSGPGWLPGPLTNRVSGRIAFAVATLKTTLWSNNTNVRLQLDEGPERRLTVANLCVANARYFGGGMKIAPDAKLDDGRFDIITIGDLSAMQILGNAPKLYFGKHLSMQQVQHTQARRLTARPADVETEIAIEVDGELPGRLPATFEILQGALRVRCPV